MTNLFATTSVRSPLTPTPISLAAALLLLVLLPAALVAQTNQTTTDKMTPTGIAPGAPAGSYPLSDFETINLFNGNLDLRLPLIALSGRGSAVRSLMVSINTKKWRVRHEHAETYDTYTPTTNNWGNVVVGYGAGKIQGRQSGWSTRTCSNPHQTRFHYTMTRLTFVTPDGTEYDLRDQNSDGQPMLASPCGGITGASRGTIFKTSDGSGITFISDTTIFDKTTLPIGQAGSWNLTVSGYLLMRDGTRYRIDSGGVSWIRDRNGNLVYSDTDAINRHVTSSVLPDGSDQFIYKGYGGAPRTITVTRTDLGSALRSGYSLQTYAQLFPELTGTYTPGNFNPGVISAVILPDGRSYQFRYNSYGELARVELPTGGAIEYDMTPSSGVVYGSGPNGEERQIYRRVVERRTYTNGSTLEGRTTYAESGGHITVDHLSASSTLLSRELHYFGGDGATSLFPADGTFYSAWYEGKEFVTSYLAADGVTVLKTVTNTWEQRAPVAWYPSSWSNGGNEPAQDPRLIQRVTTLPETNQVAKTTYSYDQYNNQTDVYEYDYGTGAAGALIRHSHTDYLTTNPVNSTNYTGTGIYLRSLATQQSVFEVNGVNETERARTSFEYDNYATDTNHAGLTDRANISGHDSSFNTGYGTRGNVTGTTNYLLTNGSVTGSVSTFAQYDIAGSPVKTIDARGYAATISYDDHFGAPDGDVHSNTAPSELASVGQTSYAFPTTFTNPLGQSVFGKLDYYLGRPVDGADLNGIVASGVYNDLLDRPTQVRRAVGTAAASQTTFSYDDPNRTITATSDFSTNNDNALVSKTLYDSFGRTTETRQYEGGSNYIATQTQYDSLGRAYKTSNPFRPWMSETAVWTTTAFDGVGRVISVTTPDSAVTSTAYFGSQVLGTDQAGKQRLSQTNALEQVKDVWEITPNNPASYPGIEPVSFNGQSLYGYHTSYSYDALDDLTNVTQGAQSRTFAYDSLKRLTSAFNPESGTVSFVYDAAGNLTQKTDARTVTTTIAYDALNRATSKSYNDNPQTPTVNYFYDAQTLPSGAPTFDRGYATGRLVAVTYGGGSAGNYTGFDALGRGVRKVQQTDSVNYLIDASYNVSAMISETYPNVPGYSDRRTVNYTFDAAGRLSSAITAATSYNLGAGVSSMGYAAHGALTTETYANNRIHGVSYNNRLQAIEVKLGHFVDPTSILDLTYSYGTTANNGNVQTIGYLGGGLANTQSFGYDALNRLTTSSETYSGGTSWSQTNGYDRYGNRWIDLGGGSQSLYFTAATNRITGSSYDNAGNLLGDGVHTYTYDAENKIRTVDGVTAYVYDGDGQRVRKLVGENTRFVYNLGGKLIMEFAGASGDVIREYQHGGGSMAMITKGVKASAAVLYLTSDTLGTPRVVTKPDGTVAARHDYKPFGEEIFAGTGGRTTAQGYSVTDSVRQKFTGKERDAETGLDYFLARFYSSTQGRFTSPDEFTGGPDELYYFVDDASANPTFYADLRNPQSLNKYQYAYNNPMRFIDPDGHDPEEAPEPQEPRPYGLQPTDPAKTKERLDNTEAQHQCAQGDCSGVDKMIPPVAIPPLLVPAPPPPPPTEARKHRSKRRKSTEETHEEGEARKKRDYGGEKGDERRRPPRRPPGGKTPKGGWPPKPPKPPKPPEPPPDPKPEHPKNKYSR